MRSGFGQHRVTAVLAALLLVSTICGASPQEGRMPRPQPQAPAPAPVPAPAPAPVRTDSRGPAETRGNREERGQRSHNRQVTADQRPPRVNRVSLYPGTRTVVPPGFVRCSSIPTLRYWQTRDIMAEIQWLSRRGFIPVTPLSDGVEELSDFVQAPAGWRAYGLAVPAGGTIQVEVAHANLGWFRLMLVNKWGEPGPGMLQAAIAHQPILVTYKNPGKEATAIYVIVDDPAWWSDAKNPYVLHIRRDWPAGSAELAQVKMVEGLWGATPTVSAEFRRPAFSGPAVFPH